MIIDLLENEAKTFIVICVVYYQRLQVINCELKCVAIVNAVEDNFERVDDLVVN